MQKGTLVYDGECRFCCLWVDRWRGIAKESIDFVPYQEAEGLSQEECAKAVQWIGPGGERASGAEAVFRVLASGSWSGKLLLTLHNKIPPWAALCNFGYAVVARHREFFSKLTALLWGRNVCKPQFSISAWIFLRLLGLIYLVFFASYWVQAPGLVGENGITPAVEFFELLEQQDSAAFWRTPSLLWLGAGDMALAGWCAAGVLASLLLMAGVAQGPALLAAWVLTLSLCVGGQGFYLFQWDSLLIETGFLAMFLAPWFRRGGPPKTAHFLLLWLLFRLVFSSAVAKLVSGDNAWWPDLTALQFHYFTQPLPTPLAWFAQHLPEWFQKGSVLGMFGIELIFPFLLFAPRHPRHAAAVGMMGLQAAILLTGNYGFFNLLTIALCLLAFDDALLVRWIPLERKPSSGSRLLLAPALVIVILSLVPLTTVFRRPLPWIEPLRPLYEAIHPFRTINSYGLFAVMTKERREILVQGTEDGFTWETYSFRFKPGDVYRAPPIVAPYMPRLDWQMWFAALGSPATNPWFPKFCERLLVAEPDVLALLESDPFEGRKPRFVRAYTDGYRFTTPAEKRETNAWWVAEPLGIYLPEVALNPSSP